MNHDQVKQQLLQNPEVRGAYENPPLQLKVARAVVEWRRGEGKSQTELAAMLGTSQNQVYRIESGDANITVKTLQRLHEVLGLEFEVCQPGRPTTIRQHLAV